MNSIKQIISKIKVFLQRENLGNLITNEGLVIYFEGDVLAVGMDVIKIDEATGESSPLEDGEYILEDGTKIVIVEGKLSEIMEPEQEVETPEEEPKPETEPEPDMLTNLTEKVKMLEEENVKIKETLEILAQSLEKLAFKKDVKMSVEKPKKEDEVNVKPISLSKNTNTQLEKIYNLMYNTKK